MTWSILAIFLVLVVLNVPIVYCMFVPSLIYLLVNNINLTVVAQRLVSGVDSFPLLAVSLFIMAGNIMNRGTVTTRLFGFAKVLVGHFSGGLAYANVLASVIFAGMSGSAMADAGGLGQIELKAMAEDGYPQDFALAVTGASSIIGPIIPPSVPMILWATTSGVSIGRLFVGGVVPGIILSLVFCGQISYMCGKQGRTPRKRATLREAWDSFRGAFFSLLTPVIILAGCVTGIFTPTETSSIAVMYTLILGICYRSIRLGDLPEILMETVRTIAAVLVLISVANLFSYVLIRAHIPQIITTGFTSVITSPAVAILVIIVMWLIVGMLTDNGPAILIFVPILMPIANFYGFDPIYFAVISVVTLMIGCLTPPVGMVLYVLAGVSNVPFVKISRAMIPFIVSCTIVVIALAYMEWLVVWLPNLVFGP